MQLDVQLGGKEANFAVKLSRIKFNRIIITLTCLSLIKLKIKCL